MTAEEAYVKLIENDRSKAFLKCASCLDFGSFFIFSLIPYEDDECLSGTTFDAVDKETGKIFEYDITNDIDAYEKAKPVSIKSYLDTPISKLR